LFVLFLLLRRLSASSSCFFVFVVFFFPCKKKRQREKRETPKQKLEKRVAAPSHKLHGYKKTRLGETIAN
jgi:hypothetical protein